MTDPVTTSNTDGKMENTNLLTTETKPDEKTVDSNAKVVDVKDDKTKPDDKPIEYTDFKLPEGFEAEPDTLGNFKTLAKEYKLTQEQAQKLVDLQASLATRQSKITEQQWADVQKGWRDSATGDKEYGGKEFNANIGVAKKALDKYGTPELKQAIELTGMGNHPEFIRLLYRVGKTLTEDKVMGGQETGAKPDAAKLLYPTMNS